MADAGRAHVTGSPMRRPRSATVRRRRSMKFCKRLLGKLAALDRALTRAAGDTTPVGLLRAAQRHFSRLHLAASAVECGAFRRRADQRDAPAPLLPGRRFVSKRRCACGRPRGCSACWNACSKPSLRPKARGRPTRPWPLRSVRDRASRARRAAAGANRRASAERTRQSPDQVVELFQRSCIPRISRPPSPCSSILTARPSSSPSLRSSARVSAAFGAVRALPGGRGFFSVGEPFCFADAKALTTTRRANGSTCGAPRGRGRVRRLSAPSSTMATDAGR